MAAVRSSNTGSAQLADHAATAALYVTDPMRKRAASEAVVQEHTNEASPLPAGLTLANASAAASLAHANQKVTSPWRPERQPYAEKAAAFVRSYQSPEPAPPSKPNPDVYKAAILAAQERVYAPTPPVVTSPEPRFDQAAFEHAMSNGNRASQQEAPAVAQISPGALTAATGAVSNRRRTESAPTKPMFHPDAAAALTAATISHRASQDARNVLSDLEPSMEAARIHHIARTNVQLYTSNPPVDIEVEEQKHKDTLRAAAISMAKDMYAKQSVPRDEPEEPNYASSAAQNRLSHRYSQSQFSWAPGDEYGPTTQRAPNLHEAAQKIAAEKLAKMQKNDLQTKQQYYGTAAGPKSRQSLTRRLRRRTSSEGDASQVDWERSERIRHQMSSLQNRVHEIDEKKSKDRADLMEIARNNVNAAIHDMDEKVYASTGKPSPHMQREWEEKAQERARKESELRMGNFGRVSVGGQKYMDQTEVEEIARSRIQPTLDEIDNRVEEQRAREIEQQLEQERKQRRLEVDRSREAELRAKEKQQQVASQGKEKEKENKLGRRRSMKGGNIFSRTSRIFTGKKTAEDNVDRVEEEREEESAIASRRNDPAPAVEQSEHEAAEVVAPAAERLNEPAVDATQLSQEQVVPEAAEAEPSTSVPTSPKSESKLRSWFRGRLPRRFSKPPPPDEKHADSVKQDNSTDVQEGGIATEHSTRAAPLASHPVTETDLTPTTASGAVHSPADEDGVNEEVARQWSSSTDNSNLGNRRWSSSPSGEGRRRRLRMSFRDMISRKSNSDAGSAAGSPLASPTSAPTSSFGHKAIGTTATTSRPAAVPRLNTMERNELHDSFTEETLPPPPTGLAEQRSISSSARDSKFSEDL